jgi:hypothetical protein
MEFTRKKVTYLLLFVVCLTFFCLQSFQELEKFASGLTSTAISTYTDDNLGYPYIAVCSRKSFKKNQFVSTAEMFDNNTYNYDEIMNPELSDSNKYVKINLVSTVRTTYRGRCYLFKADAKHSSWIAFKVRNPKQVVVDLLSKSQELCVIMDECNVEYPGINPTQDETAVSITAKKKHWAEG